MFFLSFRLDSRISLSIGWFWRSFGRFCWWWMKKFVVLIWDSERFCCRFGGWGFQFRGGGLFVGKFLVVAVKWVEVVGVVFEPVEAGIWGNFAVFGVKCWKLPLKSVVESSCKFCCWRQVWWCFGVRRAGFQASLVVESRDLVGFRVVVEFLECSRHT